MRNSRYACTLAYMGLGDTESIGNCYAQLGDSCFVSQGNTFCIGDSRKPRRGITNGDSSASALALCEVSSSESLKDRDPAYVPTATEIRDFLVPSSCDAAILSVDRAVYSSNRLSVSLDVAAFEKVAEAGHVITKVPFDECLVPTASTDSEFRATVKTVAETLSKVRVSTHSSGIMLDASTWGANECARANPGGANFTGVAAALALALVQAGTLKLFMRLPRSHELLSLIDFSQLGTFNAFVTPQGSVDMSREGHCQNMWASGSARDPSEGVMSYLFALMRQGVRANKIIFTLSLTGWLKISPLGAGVSPWYDITRELSLADMETNTVLKCEENINTKCCSGSSATVWARRVMVNITVTSTSFETLKRFPELMAMAFGINQFVVAPVDSDFRRGVRSDTPAILGITSAVHRLRDWKRQQTASGVSTVAGGPPRQRNARSVSEIGDIVDLGIAKLGDLVVDIPETEYKDPASGSKNCLDPQYTIGLSNTLVCPGLIASHGALGVFKEPHKELHGTSYEKIYIADLYKLESCTPVRYGYTRSPLPRT
ncbi:hypothetical protein KUCAC02_033069 [Chaenocephalus aceratus]|nr:hypothetical protein KUCAC02_033069 [Chaenocephalus aceratus]